MTARPAPVVLETVITCPECGGRRTETMPTDACQWFYDCRHCGAVLRPESGHCCVFCSYATVPCPPVQAGAGCCGPQRNPDRRADSGPAGRHPDASASVADGRPAGR